MLNLFGRVMRPITITIHCTPTIDPHTNYRISITTRRFASSPAAIRRDNHNHAPQLPLHQPQPLQSQKTPRGKELKSHLYAAGPSTAPLRKQAGTRQAQVELGYPMHEDSRINIEDYTPPQALSDKRSGAHHPLKRDKKAKAEKARRAWVQKIPRDLRTGANAWRATADMKGKQKEDQTSYYSSLERHSPMSRLKSAMASREQGSERVDSHSSKAASGEHTFDRSARLGDVPDRLRKGREVDVPTTSVGQGITPSTTSVDDHPNHNSLHSDPPRPSTHAHRFPFVALTLIIDPIGLPPSLNSQLYRMGFRYQHQTLFRKRSHKLSFLLSRPNVAEIIHKEFITQEGMLRRKAEKHEWIMSNAERRRALEGEAQREAIEEDARLMGGFR